MTFKLITDSTADLDDIWAKNKDVTVLGLTITLDGKTYETVGENRITSEVLLDAMKNGGKPTTSQVNVGTFEAYFRQEVKAGNDILYMAFSSVLSGTYQSAVMARDMILEEYPEARIEIVDTLAAAGGEGFLVMLAAEKRDQGLSLEQVVSEMKSITPRLYSHFLVDDLYHLMRGGRLSKSSAIVGSLVNIKPLLWIDGQGKLAPLIKVKGRKKGIREMIDRSVQDLDLGTVVVAHANDPEAAQEIEEKLLEKDGVERVLQLPLGPVIAAHVGPGTLALFSVGKRER
ncbi:DegV family protein [Streptococcus pluranimalium]|uniref:DegV domain-containing protein n=1 Tax=Streptococcus pluranimalium TaxID=82348 RepID=A0A345VMC0_9STRE|nr:DegV family protein [Streptococcus pluranimalium]AXJ13872.1 DegV domain-containing protein [Streptococcus pluranimalium]